MRWLVLAVAGGVAGALCDQAHLRSGVLWYPEPVLFGQAWWVPGVFALAAVSLVGGWRLLLPRAARTPASPRAVLVPALWFVGAYAASGWLQRWPVVFLAAGLALFAARVAWRRGPATLRFVAYALAFAVGGALFEMGLTALGGFYYHRSDVGGVALWLPVLYLHAAPLGEAIGGAWFCAPASRAVARAA